LVKIVIPVKVPLKTLKVDKSFTSQPPKVTERVVGVSDAFGLGVDEEKTFTIFKNFEIEVNPGDVVYITGESGGGKSTLLRELADQLEHYPEFGTVVRDWEIKIEGDEVVVESVGRSFEEALEILNYAGLNDAFLFLRRFRELSDGQKYRFKVAKMIDSRAGVWVFDEFCSTLDRTTAKAVAYCVQKAARKMGATLLAATAHSDLLEDLNPSVYVVKGYLAEPVVEYRIFEPHRCSLLKKVEIKEAYRGEFKKLEPFHYRQTADKLIVSKIYAAYVEGELAAVIVYTTPHFTLRGRNIAAPEYKPTKPYQEYLKRLNRDFTRIARVIVAPKFRGIGLGVKIVKDTMPLTGKKYVETLAVMAKYNPFFEKAGMRRIDLPESEDVKRIKQYLERFGFNPEFTASKRYNLSIINKLTPQQLEELSRFILSGLFADKFRRNEELEKRVAALDKEAMAEALKQRPMAAAYFIWRNPNIPEQMVKIGDEAATHLEAGAGCSLKRVHR
jgi:ABC-type dipeptide/oligopeptide/nickel transport system ATPase subunit/GNAT superfamily N-acetyltransferase